MIDNLTTTRLNLLERQVEKLQKQIAEMSAQIKIINEAIIPSTKND